MAGINRMIIVGNLGNDPDARSTPDGKPATRLSVATSTEWTDKNTNQKQKKTEWHKVVLFGKLAEIAAQYLNKGSKVYLEGRLETRKWQDQQGQDRYTTEVVVDGFDGQLQMLDTPTGNSHSQQQPESTQNHYAPRTHEQYQRDRKQEVRSKCSNYGRDHS